MKEYPASKGLDAKKKVNKQLIIRALTDPKFRKVLMAEPMEAIGVRQLSAENEVEVRFVLAAVKGIEHQIAALADELLCANGIPTVTAG
jgi:hypothetical protein